MSLKIGSVTPSKLYYGSTEIFKIYLGNNLVWNKTIGSFLLDTYTGASAAYSLRQLKTGVTNVVRVRRDSDNTEQDFTPTEITDGTLTTFVGAGNNGFVAKWYDQSGNSINAIQTVANSQPRAVNNGVVETINGKPAVSFENGSVELRAGLTTTFNTNNAHMMVVTKASYTAIGTVAASWAKNGSNTSYIGLNPYNSTTWRLAARWGGTGDDTRSTTSSPLNQHFISTSIINSTNTITIRQDDGLKYSKASASVNLNSASNVFMIGQLRTPNPTWWYNGKTQEILVFNQSVIGIDEVGIRDNVNEYFAIWASAEDGGLLHDYTGASAAYSLRQLKNYTNGYKYPLVRVRRSSDNTEQDFNETEITDGTLTTFVGANDGLVTKFYDQSGNNKDATQTVANSQPYLIESGVLCLKAASPCIRGYADKWLSKPTAITSNFTSQSAFTVGSIAESNGTTRFLFNDRIVYSHEFQGYKGNTTNAFNISTQVNNTDYYGKIKEIPQDQLFLADAQFDGVTIENYTDGVSNNGYTRGTQNSPSSALMARGNNGSGAWYGDFLEFVQFPSDESSNRTGIETNINNHYNIYGGWTPTDSASLLCWYDASDAGTITESGGEVSQWNDKSGNNYHVTQGTSTKQPETGINTLDGKNVITFSGADTMGTQGLTSSDEATIMVVLRTNNTTSFQVFASYHKDNNTTYRLLQLSTSSSSIRSSLDDNASPIFAAGSSTNTSYRVVTGTVKKGGNITSQYGNETEGSTSGVPTTPFTVNSVTIGGITNNFTQFALDGDIAEVLLFDAQLSVADIADAKRYLSTKWNVPLF